MKFYLLVFLLSFLACRSKTDKKINDTGKNLPDTNTTTRKDTTGANSAISSTELEKFGELRLGQTQSELMQILGTPASQSKPVLWEADGLMHEEWDYKDNGITINMSSEGTNANRTRTVFSITAKSPCTFKTARNMGIGSSYEEILAAYKGHIDKEASDETLITVGSVYGGILFTIKDKKAVSVFLGAAAE